jgi:hypothetical protein
MIFGFSNAFSTLCFKIVRWFCGYFVFTIIYNYKFVIFSGTDGFFILKNDFI